MEFGSASTGMSVAPFQMSRRAMHALDEGVTWVDATVAGMGRGAGNTKVEYLLIELADRHQVPLNIGPLVSLIERRFRPMQAEFGWGSNTFYYLAGRYGIDPTYVQAMLADSRYAEEDVLAGLRAGARRFHPREDRDRIRQLTRHGLHAA